MSEDNSISSVNGSSNDVCAKDDRTDSTQSLNKHLEDLPTQLSGAAAAEDLDEKRQMVRNILDVPAQEGDVWHLVSSEYLNEFFNQSVSSFSELKQGLGPVDCTCIVDQYGNLYPEDDEPIGTYNIPPACFHQLTEWFGIKGQPVSRCLIINLETGAKEVERYPPHFVVHTLSKTNSSRNYQYHSSIHNSPSGFSLSQTRTFGDLIESTKLHLSKNLSKSSKFRIWFIEAANIEEFPNLVSISTLIHDIPKKSLVCPNIFHSTMKSQGIGTARIHILVECLDKPSHKYPIDTFLNNFNFDKLDLNSTLSLGGNLGLANLGNTCYMNSALQCLLHVPEINFYFFFNLFELELNESNPLGNKGDVAITFGSLLHKLFDNSNTSQSYVSPRDFKHTIGRYSSLFQGYQQQDSQEFLSWLLDALHEDLNRIYNKPYCEKPELKDEDINNSNAILELARTCWDQHKKRNDSIIVDLFTGMYQSTLVCPECSKTSITFDPFNDLTLPLPINKKWYHTFTVVNLTQSESNPIVKLEVELNKTSNYDELMKYISNFLKVPPHFLFLFEIFRGSFYKDFQENYDRLKFFPMSEIIGTADDVLIYVIPHDPQNDIIVPVLNTVPDDSTYNMTEPFGLPLFIVLDRKFEVNSFGKIRSKLEQVVKILSKANIEEQYNELKSSPNENTKYFSSKDFPLITKKGSSEDDIVMVGSDVGKSPTKETQDSIQSDQLDTDPDYDEGYDSDISLANPNVGGNFGFEIKYHYENHQSYRPRGYNRFNSYSSSDSSDNNDRPLNIPHSRPLFRSLPSLAVQLPELKRNYYHYPDYSAQLDREIQDIADEVNENLTDENQDDSNKKSLQSADSNDKKNTEDFVLVDKNTEQLTNMDSPSVQAPEAASQQLLDEDTESESNLGTLFDSVHALAPPTAYSESGRDSIQDSPGEEESKIDNHPVLVDKNVTLICEWNPEIYSKFFKEPELQNWIDLENLPNPELEANKAKLARQQKSTISLYDCLSSFSTPEVLGDQDLWYCPRCKDHRQATKTIQIWSTGDLLTIHLKRFQSARSFSDKIDITVDFPIEGLDISPYVASRKLEEESETIDGDVPFQIQKNDLVYDLIAVDNHYGGLGGGHYTASVKNFRDGKWYYYNDGRVTPIKDARECVSGAAYLLFYRKRTASNLVGGERVQTLINEGRMKYEQTLKDTNNKLTTVKNQVEAYSELEREEIKKVTEQEELKKEAEAEVSAKELESKDSESLDFSSNVNHLTSSTSSTSSSASTSSPPSKTAPVSTKKSRSPGTDDLSASSENQGDSFNKRKQRLISKDDNENKSIHINDPPLSSLSLQPTSNVASPDSSSSDEVILN